MAKQSAVHFIHGVAEEAKTVWEEAEGTASALWKLRQHFTPEPVSLSCHGL